MSSTLEWIRRNYNVPAFQGQPITYLGKPAVILGGHRQYLRLRVDGAKRPVVAHPTSSVRYPVLPLPRTPKGWCGFCLQERSLCKDGTVYRHLRPGHETFPSVDTQCPGAGDKPWAVCSWTVPAPGAPAKTTAVVVLAHDKEGAVL